MKPGDIETTRLIKLLNEIATSTSEADGYFRVSEYKIETALESLGQRDDVDRMELVRLEYLYVDILTPFSKYEIPNISKEIAESPLSFMRLLALSFKRNDNDEDPPEWQLPTEPEHRQNVAGRAYSALEHASVIPGTQSNGKIDTRQLCNWVIDVRKLAREHGRLDIADQRIGQILSKSTADEDSVWPRKEVRQVVEEIASRHICTGMEVGLRNARGVSWRGEGGSQEHELAEKYRNLSEKVMNKTPLVGRMLLNIAESYEHDANWHDTDDKVRRRLRD